MFKILFERLRQGYRTVNYPPPDSAFAERFRGAPLIAQEKCPAGCQACMAACPTNAIADQNTHKTVDLGRCLFCTDCTQACDQSAIKMSREWRIASARREDLLVDGIDPALVAAANKKITSLFGRSLKLRQVSAGGCNGCEVDINVLETLVFDLSRFGIQMVASPRHADGLIVTGPVTTNMRLALQKTYAAVAEPKIVIAVGTCAISGGLFAPHRDESNQGIADILPVDLYIPGCPPHPWTILDGMMRFLDKAHNS